VARADPRCIGCMLIMIAVQGATRLVVAAWHQGPRPPELLAATVALNDCAEG